MHLEDRDAPALYRLPTELISDIFLLVVAFPSNGDPAYDPKNGLELRPLRGEISPLLLCKICRRWRSIAFSTPLLWARLRIKFKKPLSDGYERHLLRQWLDRAGTCPLSLTIFDTLYDNVCFTDEGSQEHSLDAGLSLLVYSMLLEGSTSTRSLARSQMACLFLKRSIGN